MQIVEAVDENVYRDPMKFIQHELLPLTVTCSGCKSVLVIDFISDLEWWYEPSYDKDVGYYSNDKQTVPAQHIVRIKCSLCEQYSKVNLFARRSVHDEDRIYNYFFQHAKWIDKQLFFIFERLHPAVLAIYGITFVVLMIVLVINIFY